MNRRDTNIEVECLICGRSFNFLVNSEGLEKFQSSSITEINPQDIFPYLENDEADFITIQICSNCI